MRDTSIRAVFRRFAHRLPDLHPGDRHSCLSVEQMAQMKGQTGMSVPQSWLRGLACNAFENRSRWRSAFLLVAGLLSTGPSPTRADVPPRRVVTPAEVARWNDRSTPRRTLETFWFAVYCYDVSPELIVNAIDCLDLGGVDSEMRERDAALMAHQLNLISSRLDIPLYSVPERPEADTVALTEVTGFHLVLVRQPDGRWRFDRETVAGIGRMRGLMVDQHQLVQDARLKMAEGRTDPEATMRTFNGAVFRQDFAAAAQCLDLHDVPAKLRAERGPVLARKLAFVIQRCGFVFPQELPSDPAGFRHVWHSNHRGRIMLDRVRMADGKDAWLFARGTLLNLDALVEGFRNVPPDPRYVSLGAPVDDAILKGGQAGRVTAPAGVSAALGSPRSTLRSFLEAMDDLEFDDGKARVVLSCLDLRDSPALGRNSVGLRLASKLEAVLRHDGVDLLDVSDSWQAEPVVLGRETAWQVTIARNADGAWQFDQETMARVPDMFDQLTPAEKSARDLRSSFHSARQTMRTLLHAVNAGDLRTAAECLDLDNIPAGARPDLGPLLASKLKFVLDRLGLVVVQEIPDEPSGPRYYYYRGALGRIDLVRRETSPRQGDWQFSDETVARLEAMFLAVLDRPADLPPGVQEAGVRTEPSLRLTPALWVRRHVPSWLRLSMAGLDAYQWLGLGAVALTSVAAGWLGLRAVVRIIALLLLRAQMALSRPFLWSRLRPLGMQLSLWAAYVGLRWLDLPVPVFSALIPMIKVVWIGLLAWTALGAIDLVMAVYTHSDHLSSQRSLSDMIVPTAVRGLKLVVVLTAVIGQVYLVGNGETLTKLLACLGLVGLAASLAAQDTLKNFFGTLLLIGEHPFRIGDQIVVNGMEGAVESVGFRSTRIRTPDDSLLTIPNSVIANASIDNRGARNYRRLRKIVALGYRTPLDRLLALRDSIRAFALAHPKVRHDKVDVHIHGLGGHAIDLLVNVYLRVATWTEELECRDQFSLEILRQADSLGIEVGEPDPSGKWHRHPRHDESIPAPHASGDGGLRAVEAPGSTAGSKSRRSRNNGPGPRGAGA